MIQKLWVTKSNRITTYCLIVKNIENRSVEKSDETNIVLKNILKCSEMVQNWNKINSQYPNYVHTPLDIKYNLLYPITK